MGRIAPDVWLLILIFSVMLPMRIVQTAQMPDLGIDGGYYAEVARHVRDGQGLSSHASLYHAGDSEFPHPTSIYPLWPLLLGLLSRAVDLEILAHWLPMGLSFVALSLAFLFGRRLWPEPMLPRVLPSFHAGHLLVLGLGLQRDFITFTSLPFTEALSWTVLFLFLLRAWRAPNSLLWALELGCWTATLYFCRAQLIVFPIAALMASGLAVLTGPGRGGALARLAITSAVIVGALGAYWRWLSTFVVDADLSSLLRFDQNRASTLLEPFDVIVEQADLSSLLLDRAMGLVHGWDLLSSHSYQAVFYATHWALPVAIPLLVAVGWRAWRAQGWSGALAWLRGPRASAWVMLLLASAGGLASIQLAHKHFNGEWYFDNRQSMICVLPFFLALGWLLRQPGSLPSLLASSLLATSTLLGVRELSDQMIRPAEAIRDDSDNGQELARWLNRQAKDTPLRVVMPGGRLQRVSWRTHNVGYHWFYEETSYDDLLTMTDRLGADLVFYGDDATRSWRFRREGAGSLARDFELLVDVPGGMTVLKRRRTPPRPAMLLRPRVIVVGVDGASWKVIGPMIERGELPTFARLREEGASDVEFDTLDITRSPVVWTSVATGRTPEVHGVTDYTTKLPDGSMVPVTSDVRKVPALWNLVSEAGLTVLTVNWWASWPAEEVRGKVVSDHANPAAAGWMAGRYWEADANALAAMHKDTFPPEFAEELATRWFDPEAFPLDELQARAQLSPEQLAATAAAPFNKRETYSWLKTFYALDRPHLSIALDELATEPADLTMLYLRGPDPVQHYAWDTVEPWRYARPPKDADRGVIQGIYRYVDSFLAEILAAADPNTVVIVLSDHGSEPSRGADRAHFHGRPGGHTRSAKGVLFVWGANVRRAVRVVGAGPLDIAPTVAWLLGLPVAKDLEGRVLAEAFTPQLQRQQGAQRVPSWGTRVVEGASTASPADANMMEQLRGLGYIE